MARVIILLLVIFYLLNPPLSRLPNVMVEGATVVALGRGGGGRGSSRGGGRGSSHGSGGSPRRGSGRGRGTAPFLVGAGAGVAASGDGGRYQRSSNYSAAAHCAHAGRTLRIGIIAGVTALLH